MAWGARTDRPWVVVVAVTIATPRLYFQTPAMLVGLLYYVRPHVVLARPTGPAIVAGASVALEPVPVELATRDPARRRDLPGGVPARRAARDEPLDLGPAGEASRPPPAPPRRAPTVGRSPTTRANSPRRVSPPVGQPVGQLAQRAADDLLVELGQLPADGGRAIGAAGGGEVAQGRRRPVTAPRTRRSPARRRRSGPADRVRSRPVRGRNPSNVQRGPARPDAATAASTAEAPGSGTTTPPALAQARTSSSPGSLTPGVPASVTSARSGPARRWSSSSGQPSLGVPGVEADEPGLDLVAASSRRLIRVSSAAMSGTARSVSSARTVTSPRLPIGVATTNSRPPAGSVTGPDDPTRPRSRLGRARSPARVEVVDPGRPRTELGDRRDLALELGRRRRRGSPRSTRSAAKPLATSSSGERRLSTSQNSSSVELRVAEPGLALVGLAGPQVGRRRLGDDRVGHADRGRELADLALVQVADRVERRWRCRRTGSCSRSATRSCCRSRRRARARSPSGRTGPPSASGP